MRASDKYLPNVSIVVIGLNEEKNLHNTFKEINNVDYPDDKYEIIYVDTGSTDNSVEIAKKYTNKVFLEKSNWPTPGLARNRGIVEAKYDIIHFIDGDIQIDVKYLKAAVQKLKQKNVDAVYGFLEELKPKGINKILLSHWKNKVEGYSNATGGGGTYKKDALLAINGYDERIKKGQETELGERFRKAGYNIYYMNIPMGVHDYGITNLSALLKKYFIDGKSKFVNYLISDTQNDFFKSNNNLLMKNVIEMFVWFIFLLASFFLHWLIFPLFLISYAVLIFIKYFFFRKIRNQKEILYFLIMNFAKPITFIGSVNAFFVYLFNHLQGEKAYPDKMLLSQ